MRLLAHNSFVCPKPKCRGFPLVLTAAQVIQEKKDFDADFIVNVLEILDYPALRQSCQQVGITDMPPHLPSLEQIPPEQQEPFLRSLHKVLLETKLLEGNLRCPKCNAELQISQGIVHCLVKEEEFLGSANMAEEEEEVDESVDEDVEMN